MKLVPQRRWCAGKENCNAFQIFSLARIKSEDALGGCLCTFIFFFLIVNQHAKIWRTLERDVTHQNETFSTKIGSSAYSNTRHTAENKS